MAEWLHGREYLERQRRLLAIIEPEEAFDKSSLPYLSHLERRKFALRKEKRFTQLAREHGWTQEDMTMAENLIGVPGQFKLHRESGSRPLAAVADRRSVHGDAPLADHRRAEEALPRAGAEL